jgi:hypothetical protein
MNKTYLDYLPKSGRITEHDVWKSIADAAGVDVNEISDGDLSEYL